MRHDRAGYVAAARADNTLKGYRAIGPSGATAPLVRLYSEYMHVEYGELDSDYVSVNLWGGHKGRPVNRSLFTGNDHSAYIW